MKPNTLFKEVQQRDLHDHVQGLGLKTPVTDIELATDGKTEVETTASHRELTENHDIELQTLDYDVIPGLHDHHLRNAEPHLIRVTKSGDHTVTIQQKHGSSAHLALIVEPNIDAALTMQTVTEGFSTQYLDVILREGSSLRLTDVRRGQKESIHYTQRASRTEKDSTLRWVQCDTAGKRLYNFTRNHLIGENSEARITNMYYGANEEEFDVSLESRHTGRNTYSFIRSRGALQSAKSTQRGLVRINVDAAESDGYQKADALLLDKKAHIVSIPDLEIRNPEVKCSHGSTVTNLDEEKLFYLNSKGIGDKAAKNALIEGFYTPYIERAGDDVNDLLTELLITRAQQNLK